MKALEGANILPREPKLATTQIRPMNQNQNQRREFPRDRGRLLPHNEASGPTPVTVADHHDFRESLATLAFDEIDEAAADHIHDHAPQTGTKHKVRGVLNILDQIEKENVNRRFRV